ncbi:head GIN domain-containing protein [Chitinophaga sp. MM2321]|uniref:head GIN domain-containing protein n=1 Tax=Chitinophaga sp. MM2321 TaxID=3137178 RepID=UPI0032D595ED
MKKQFLITYTSLSVGWFLLMLAIFALILGGCTKERITGSGNVVEETRTTAPFTEVEISGAFEVHLLQDSSAQVVIKAEDNIMGVIETGTHGNILYVRTKNHVNIRRHMPIHIYVHSRLFQRITFSGSGSLDNKDTLQSTSFRYVLNGSANASLALATTAISTTINGSGDLIMKGHATTLNSDINGSGNISALDMTVQTADITIRGSGAHTIQVEKELRVSILGSGNVTYSGTPTKLETDIKGSGKLIKI